MNEKESKKIYNKMKKEGILPDFFTGNWERDKSVFIKNLSMDEKIDITYDELSLDDDYYDYEY